MTDTKHTLSPRTRAWVLRSVALFAVFCAAWILLGNRLVGALIGSPGASAITAVLNGLLFVAIASWWLWSLMRRAAGGDTAQPEHGRAAESERRRVMFEQSVDGMVVLGKDGRVRECNRSFADMLGYTVEEVGSLCVWDWDAQWTREELLEILQRHPLPLRTFETRHRRKDGSCYDAEVSSNAMEVDGQTLIYAVTRDVTERKEAERKLREREACLTAILDNMPHLAWLKDREGRYMAVNRKYAQMAGASQPAELLGKTDFDLWPRELAEQYRAGDLEVMTTREQRLIEEKGIDHGREYIAETFKTPIIDESGELLGTTGYAHDVTARRAVENELRESESRFRRMADSAPVMIWMDGPDRRSEYYNRRWLDFTGRTLEEEIADSYAAGVTHSEDHPRFMQVYDRALAAREPFTLEYRLKRADNVYRWILDTGVPRFDAAGKLLGYIGSCIDITELKQTQESLRASEALYRSVVTAMVEGVCVQDATGTITYMNPAGERIEGRTVEQMRGMTSEDSSWQAIHEDGTPFPGQMHPAMVTLRTGQPQSNVIMGLQRPDGSRVWIAVNSQPLIAEGESKPYAVVTTFNDVTAARQAEAEREVLQAQLLQARKMEAIGQLTGGIAHDFNNILAIMLGYVELAMDQCGPDGDVRLTEYLSNVRQAGERARDLIAKMLVFSRSRRGRTPTPLRLQLLVEEVVDMVGPMIPSSIQITAHIDRDVPPVLVEAVELHQMLVNLAINARDAMSGHGRMDIAVRRVHEDAVCTSCHAAVRGEFVQLSVSDTGTGMHADVLSHIFEPYFTTKELGKGTGMGLPVAHGIMHKSGGHILVDSTVGVGTTVRLLFAPVDVDVAAVIEARNAVAPAPPPDSSAARVLVVDDEPQLASIISRVLSKHGYRVDTYCDSAAALRAFDAAPQDYDAVITDQTMPGLSGDALARAILELNPGIPIILCTGYSETIGPDSAAKAGIARYLRKPVPAQQLLGTLEELLAASAVSER
jgi:PAS domain S-box-containing protein